jgi:hypothetical protein
VSDDHDEEDRAALEDFVRSGRRLVEAHESFQRSMTEAHVAFLRALEAHHAHHAALLAERGQAPPPTASAAESSELEPREAQSRRAAALAAVTPTDESARVSPTSGQAEAPHPTSATDAPEEPARWTLTLVDAPLPPVDHSQIPDEMSVAIVDDRFGVAEALASLVEEEGHRVEIVEGGGALGDSAHDALVHLGGLRGASSADEAVTTLHDAFAMVSRASTETAVLLAFDAGGSLGLEAFDPPRAPLGGLAALARSSVRWGLTDSARAVDIDGYGRAPGLLAEWLLEELRACFSDEQTRLACRGEIGRRAPARRRRSVPKAGASGELRYLDDSSVVLVSGATAPPMSELAAAIGAQSGASVVVVDERAPDHDAVRETLTRLEDSGVRARYVRFATERFTTMLDELDAVRAELGPIDALIHGVAPTLDDSRTSGGPEASGPDIESVLASVLHRPSSLLAAIASDPIELVGFVTGVAARPSPIEDTARDMETARYHVAHAMAEGALRTTARGEHQRLGGEPTFRAIELGSEQELGGRLDAVVEELRREADGVVEVVVGHSGSGEA